uniref:Ig-like domain-containing protein n=1 Tax=Amphilophus citrinellus TaxID=61819 RepID=A0A3Q0RBF7_AMPCI
MIIVCCTLHMMTATYHKMCNENCSMEVHCTRIITTESGQNVTLTCRAPKNNIVAVKWSRADLGDEYVLLYRDEQFAPEEQHPSFKNRVDLQDRQMKDGDVSLILKNVTINDAGTYECRVFSRGTNHKNHRPITSVSLRVVAPSVPAVLLVAAVFGFVIYRKPGVITASCLLFFKLSQVYFCIFFIVCAVFLFDLKFSENTKYII